MGIKYDILENIDNEDITQRVLTTKDDFFLPTNFLTLELSQDDWVEECLENNIAVIMLKGMLFISLNGIIKLFSKFLPERQTELNDAYARLMKKKEALQPQPFEYEAEDYSALC